MNLLLLKNMLQHSVDVSPASLHPGAEKYYKEAGILE